MSQHNGSSQTATAYPTQHTSPIRVLITAGPTHEPIDSVRFLGNRSSGRMGVALAQAFAQLGAQVELLLGPTHLEPPKDPIKVSRFTSHRDLQAMLSERSESANIIVMAAAVADFTPSKLASSGKIQRPLSGTPVTLELVPTTDLLAELSEQRQKRIAADGTHQLLVGFALEPADRLTESALAKLDRKGVDAIVANPLETMDSENIDATVFTTQDRSGITMTDSLGSNPATKAEFAVWLAELLTKLAEQRSEHNASTRSHTQTAAPAGAPQPRGART